MDTTEHRDLLETLARLYEELFASYAGREADVLEAADRCASYLRDENGNLGKWENAEIEYAKLAVGDGFLRLAVSALVKAVKVSELPPDEYEYGFNYNRLDK